MCRDLSLYFAKTEHPWKYFLERRNTKALFYQNVDDILMDGYMLYHKVKKLTDALQVIHFQKTIANILIFSTVKR